MRGSVWIQTGTLTGSVQGGSWTGISTVSELPAESRVTPGQSDTGLYQLHHQGMKLFMIDMGREIFRPIPVTSYRMPPISAVMLRIDASIPRM